MRTVSIASRKLSDLGNNLHQLLHIPVFPNSIADYIGGFLLFCSLIIFLLAYDLFDLKYWAWLISLIFQTLGLFAFFLYFINREQRLD